MPAGLAGHGSPGGSGGVRVYPVKFPSEKESSSWIYLFPSAVMIAIQVNVYV